MQSTVTGGTSGIIVLAVKVKLRRLQLPICPNWVAGRFTAAVLSVRVKICVVLIRHAHQPCWRPRFPRHRHFTAVKCAEFNMYTGTHVVIVLNLINSSVLLMLGSTFYSRVIDAWNGLSNDVVKSPSVCMFKKRRHNVNLDRFLTITYWLFLAVYCFLSLF